MGRRTTRGSILRLYEISSSPTGKKGAHPRYSKPGLRLQRSTKMDSPAQYIFVLTAGKKSAKFPGCNSGKSSTARRGRRPARSYPLKKRDGRIKWPETRSRRGYWRASITLAARAQEIDRSWEGPLYVGWRLYLGWQYLRIISLSLD
jgi:hypothetical protein